MAVDVAPPAQELPDAVMRLVEEFTAMAAGIPWSDDLLDGMRGRRWTRPARARDEDGAHNWRHQRAREAANQGRRFVLSEEISSRHSVSPRPAPRWARPARLLGQPFLLRPERPQTGHRMAAAAGEQIAATGLVPSVLGVQRASAETSLRGEDRYVRRLCPCQGSMRVELVSGARVRPSD